MTTIVTTSLDLLDTNFAQKLAKDNSWEYIARTNLTNIDFLSHKIIVVEKLKISLRCGDDTLFFHPGLSLLRINNILSGEGDRFIEACQLKRGDRFLDCTLGLASDAIVASYITGNTGTVTGLEIVPEIAVITKYGLENYKYENINMDDTLKRIQVKTIAAENYLTSTKKMFDCIYFDPMFKKPNLNSSGINMIRPFAYKKELTREDIELALTKTNRSVVVKERSIEKLRELKPDEILGGKNTKIFYARWNKQVI